MRTSLPTISDWDHARELATVSSAQATVLVSQPAKKQFLHLRSHYAVHLCLAGELKYQWEGQRHTLEANQYLLFNPGQEISWQKVGENPAQIVAIYLPLDRVQRVLERFQTEADWHEVKTCLLADGRLELCEQPYEAMLSEAGRYLIKLGESLRNHTNVSPQEATAISVAVTSQLVEAQYEVFRQMLRLTSAKLSTKKELYRRLCMARAYMHENLHENLDLDTLAQVACLSKYHFIRLFKEAFGQTPRQYLIARRLERARRLLVHSSKTFHDICQEVGLKDSSSFGRLFKRNFGATPHLYRQMHRA